MKKLIGYGYKLSRESLVRAQAYYGMGCYYRNRKEAVKAIKRDKKNWVNF